MFCISKRSLILVLLFTGLLRQVSADNLVQINISDKITANAAFYQGEVEKPVILILHGFMLTHHFPTVKRLADSLHESGYTVRARSL
ncbi:MAG: hypothetical protein KZQ64_08580 [gamma proteobacterium symbiont of Bathyaustriella thionipta]|nr:hypothetical protein [gamma proteobacterium symbiont of Bathyaustriella thionipta]MCU7950845.1 hypothetical protein [gamma proteobacterium symbiont of Bathyaustriella thionipta]MCU7953428.1 hypothetical protein [gamma proteobacterium symbiont of Bathyaustriella thionipta]MCU7958296.1 hypothetical protein [gamma proteobacterium symbiont of Bathyaustriella thionipta]MCU7967759.1 hypothetical protein [gamma proteobacterium symbiont of Bathyaustriella thionipta]